MFRSARDIVRINTQEPAYIEDELYGCDYCSAGGWVSETEIEIHKSREHKEQIKTILETKQFVCGICINQYTNNEDLLKHIKSEHLYSSEDAYRVEREIFVCDDCCQLFFNKQHLIIHIAQNHSHSPNTQLVQCPQCKLSVKRNHIWVHFHKHMLQSISTCRICFIKSKNRRELKEHLKSHLHHFKCDICGYSTNKSPLFHQHVHDFHRNSTKLDKLKGIKRYFIPKNDIFVGKCQILMIFRGVNLTNGVKICILCREICVDGKEMKAHIQEHCRAAVTVKQVYVCSCGEVFNNKVLLTHHIFKLKGEHRAMKL